MLEPDLDLSVVAPAHNEVENVALLIEQVGAALGGAGLRFEFILVDDASTDGTAERACSLMEGRSWLRVVSLSRPARGGRVGGGGNGQSAAFRAGFAAARGGLVGVLDADLQNDPAELTRMIARLRETGADCVQGDRSAARALGDPWVRRAGSAVGRVFRRLLLGDTIRDTGCSLRVLRREVACAIPLELRGMHRFIPVTARQLGYTVVEMPVTHRARHAGEPKYGMGITKRALPGLVDCLGVRWMGSRRCGAAGVVEHVREAPVARGVEGARA